MARTARDVYLTQKYGITEQQHYDMMLVQDCRCANEACAVELTQTKSRVDMRDGKFRGLLCPKCKGALQDESLPWLQGLFDYVRRTQ